MTVWKKDLLHHLVITQQACDRIPNGCLLQPPSGSSQASSLQKAVTVGNRLVEGNPVPNEATQAGTGLFRALEMLA